MPELTLEQKMAARGYLPASKVAERYPCSVYTVYRWIKNGKIDGEKFLGHWFVTVDSLIAMLGSEKAKVLGFLKEEGEAGEAATVQHQDPG